MNLSPQARLCCLNFLRHWWSLVFSSSFNNNSILPTAQVEDPGVTPDLRANPEGSTFRIRCRPDSLITTGPSGSPGPAWNVAGTCLRLTWNTEPGRALSPLTLQGRPRLAPSLLLPSLLPPPTPRSLSPAQHQRLLSTTTGLRLSSARPTPGHEGPAPRPLDLTPSLLLSSLPLGFSSCLTPQGLTP